MSKWKLDFATIGNLWINEHDTPVRSVVVINDSVETDVADVQLGFARFDNDWYKVVCIGEGDWQAAWSDRQQRFITIQSESMIGKLNDFAGLSVK